jgi:YegS/Rv2252/BmrU family lipid kinase
MLPKLTALFEKHTMPHTVHTTAAPMDAYRMAAAACPSDGIIGIGGDGTMQEIAAGMATSAQRPPLGIMPCGSGNDFIFTLNGKGKINPDALLDGFFAGVRQNKTRAVDLIKVGDTACLNIANMGIDAQIVQNAIAYKKRFGQHAYLAATYKTIAKYKNIPLTVQVNGQAFEGLFTLLAACNGQYYGGGMRIAPGAVVDDGKITLCLADGMSRPRIMIMFPSLLAQWHTRLKEVRFIECERFTLHWQGEQTLCLDGNLYPFTSPLTFEIMPKALELFVGDVRKTDVVAD